MAPGRSRYILVPLGRRGWNQWLEWIRRSTVVVKSEGCEFRGLGWVPGCHRDIVSPWPWNLTKHQFPLVIVWNYITYLMGLLWWCNEVMQVKRLAPCWALGKPSVTVQVLTERKAICSAFLFLRLLIAGSLCHSENEWPMSGSRSSSSPLLS